MSDEEGIRQAQEKYLADVKWLRDHIALDDIYDFAQQVLLAAEHLVGKLSDIVDLDQECEQDPETENWVNNILSLTILKDSGFDGILDVTWRVQKR